MGAAHGFRAGCSLRCSVGWCGFGILGFKALWFQGSAVLVFFGVILYDGYGSRVQGFRGFGCRDSEVQGFWLGNAQHSGS